MKSDNLSPYVTKIILESISNGVFTVDHYWRITSFNRAAEEITGIPRSEAVGKHCWDVFRSNMCEKDCALRRTMKLGKDFVDTSTYIVNDKQKRIPVVVCTSVLRDENGKELGGVETFRDMSAIEALRKELDGRHQIGDMISRSPAMHKIFNILPQIAESDSPALIQGETGTGKEVLARALHELSPRKDKPFIPVNCGALPETLLESELFGYKAGAFTNAVKDKPGIFSLAQGGTILLDEINDISPAFQVRLLRVLQEHKFQPLGAVKEIDADVRIISASNADISTMVENGSFRQDLFYRINVIRLNLPPLRNRKEDIPLLIENFTNKLNLIRNKKVTGVSRETLAALMSHDYPGNIRELENIIEHAFVLCPEGQIELNCLPDNFHPSSKTAAAKGSIDSVLKSVEAQTIIDALKRNDFNRLAAANELRIHKSTLFRKIKKLGIALPKTDGRSARPKNQ